MFNKLPSKKTDGFSLIELMIVVAIIGIIMAVAVPSYSAYMEKTRRVDGTSFLIEAAGEQIRFFSEYNRYGTTMEELGYGTAATADSNDGHYTVSVVSNTDTSYVLTATPVAGGQQDGDDECAAFTLTSSEQKGITGTGTPGGCW